MCSLKLALEWPLKKYPLINSLSIAKTKRKYIVEAIDTTVDFSTTTESKTSQRKFRVGNYFFKVASDESPCHLSFRLLCTLEKKYQENLF